MSRMTRSEIVELHRNFVDQVEKSLSKHPKAMDGLSIISNAIDKEDDAPSLDLINLGRLMKTYISDVKKKPQQTIEQFNAAVDLVVHRGMDIQQAMRQARLVVERSGKKQKQNQPKQVYA